MKTKLIEKRINKKLEESKYTSYNKDNGWTDEDIKIHSTVDWAKRNYMDLDVGDSFRGRAVLYGKEKPEYAPVEFHKFLRANSIYPPYYAPAEKPFEGKVVGPMYDGNKHKTYQIHDRYETQELYDMMFD